MRSCSCAVVLLACVAVGWAEPGAPYLVVNPEGHVGAVERMAFSADGTRLVSCGTDGAARVWNVADGELLRTIRLPAVSAGVCMDHAMAVAPDGRLVAAELQAPYREIWVCDTTSGALVRRVPLPGTDVGCLEFSPSGRLLARYHGDVVDIYAVADGRLRQSITAPRDTITTPRYYINRLSWASSEDRLAICCNGRPPDSMMIVASLAGGAAPQVARQDAIAYSSMWSPDGRTIAVVTGIRPPWLATYDAARLDPGPALGGMDRVDAAAYNQAGDSLWTFSFMDSTVQDRDPATLQVRRILPAKFTDVRALVLRADRLAVGANVGEITLWDTGSARRLRTWRGPGQAVSYTGWSVDGQRLAWSNIAGPSAYPPQGSLERAFDLANWVPQPPANEDWRQAVVDDGHGSLERVPGPTTNQIIAHRQGLPDVLVQLDGSVIWRFSLLPDGRVMVAGNHGVSLFDQLGKQVRQWRGAPVNHYGVATSSDGRYVLSGGDDQTLRIWPFDAKEKVVPPLLSLFVGDDGDWIAWTQDGYYACTPGAERWIAWQRDYADRMPDVYPVYQFRERYYRPDVIKLVLKHGDVSKALAEADAQRGRQSVATVTTPGAPPAVTVLAPADGATVTATEVDLRARVTDPGGHAIRRIHVTVNGRSIDGARFVFVPIRDEPGVWATRAPLSPGECTLSVVATNDVGAESLPASIKVTCQPAAEGPPPSLYVLAVGVGKYAKAEYNLKYAGADAIALAEALRAGAGKLYQKVGLKVLSDDQATRAGVLDGLEWLSQQVTQRDLAVVFMAGHGVPDVRNDYQFLPFDGDVEKLISTGVKWTDIRAVLSKLPGRVILALDTCHSAGVTGARMVGPRLDYTNLLREAATDEVGLVTLSSCMPHEVSLENEAWQHGAFTKAMIEALQGQADNNHDGIVSLAEVDAYVSERVKELTGGRQHPTSQRPATIRSSLPLALCDVAGK